MLLVLALNFMGINQVTVNDVLFVYMCCLSSVCVVTSPILQRFSYQIITCRVNSLFFCFHLSLESNGLFYSTFFKIDFLYYHLKWL